MTTETFKVWRAELAAEITAAEQAHAVAIAELETATIAAREAKVDRRMLADAFARLHPGTTLATALANRRHAADDESHRAESRLALATGTAKNAARLVADLQQALQQIEQIDPPKPALLIDADATDEMDDAERLEFIDAV